MHASLWSFLLCFCFMTLPDFIGSDFLLLNRLYSQKTLQKGIYIRLVKREWRPEGPSADTDEVMEEYKWDVDKAFNALKKSSYQFESVPLEQVEELYKGENYDKNLDSIVIIHPILASADVFFVKTTITALAMRNLHRKYNVFAVQMPKLNNQMVLSVLNSLAGSDTFYDPMSKAVSQLLVRGTNAGYISPERIHLIGWSYSGQLVGYIGRYMQARYNMKIASILSLDPWTNGINHNLIHVSKDDAHVVHTYHSNSLIAGSRERIATADFIFNDGITQPECKWPSVLKSSVKESMICSHLKVVQRFWYVVLFPSKFVARKCDSWNRFTSCYCTGNPTATMSYPIKLDQQVGGIHYLRTLNTKPYGVGKWGASCTSDKKMLQELDKDGLTLCDSCDYQQARSSDNNDCQRICKK